MSKTMSRFEFAYKATDQMKLKAKMPFRRDAVNRALDSAVDSLREASFDLNEEIAELRTRLYTSARGDDKQEIITNLVDAQMQLEDNEQAIAILLAEKDEMAVAVPVEE